MRCFYCEKKFDVLSKCAGGCGNYFCLDCLNKFGLCKKCAQPIKCDDVVKPKQVGLFEKKYKKRDIKITKQSEQKSLF